MEPSSLPPKGVLDPEQPWYKGRVRDETWNILKLKLTGGRDSSGVQHSSFVNLNDEDADTLINNLKKDQRGYPQLNTPGGLLGEDYRKEYQEWLVKEYLYKPQSEDSELPSEDDDDEIDEDSKELDNILDLIREKEEDIQDDKEEPEDLDELIASISEEKVQKAKNFLGQPKSTKKIRLSKPKSSGIIPKKVISQNKNQDSEEDIPEGLDDLIKSISGIIPKSGITEENISRITKPPEVAPEEPKQKYKRSLNSSLKKLGSDLEIINLNLLRIKKIISDDFKGRQKISNTEIEENKKRVANRSRFIGKKDSKDSKSGVLGSVKKYAGSFFSGIGGAIRAISAFSLLDALISGDPSKLIGPIVAIGLSYLPTIGAGIAGAIVTSLTKKLSNIKGITNIFSKDEPKNIKPIDVDAPKTSTPKPAKPPAKKSFLGNIGKSLKSLKGNKIAKIGGKAALVGGGIALLSGILSPSKAATTSTEETADYLSTDNTSKQTPKIQKKEKEAQQETTKDKQEERLKELTEQQKKLVNPKNLVPITQDDLKRFERLNKKFEEALDFLIKVQKEQATKGGKSGGGGGSAPSSSPGTMNVSNDGGASGFSSSSSGGLQIGKELAQNLMRDKGLRPELAAAISGNARYESDEFKADTEYAANSYGTKGRGWIQWTDTGEGGAKRRTIFENFSKQKGLDPKSKEANYQFLLHEMSGGTGHNYWIGGYSYEGFLKIKNVDEATRYFMKGYLRPAPETANLSERQRRAREVLSNIGKPSSKPNAATQIMASGSSGGQIVASRSNQRSLSPVASKPSVTVVPMSVAQATPQKKSSTVTSSNDTVPNVNTTYSDNIFSTYSKSLYQVLG